MSESHTIVILIFISAVVEAYDASMYSMARLNRTGAKLMAKYGTYVRVQWNPS